MGFSVRVLEEGGYESAMLGLSLSYGQPVEKMPEVAAKLCGRDNGENKFLESIQLWLHIDAPRYWWQEFDTYRVGITKQSESTMHTLLKGPLKQDDFAKPIPVQMLSELNDCINADDLAGLKNLLPEGFIQGRVVSMNYKALRHVVQQREKHRLEEWREFCQAVRAQVEHPGFLE